MGEIAPQTRRAAWSTLSIAELALLWSILTIGLLLRVVALDWGLPPVTPEIAASGIRSSYAFDEKDVLSALARTDPARFDFDPKLYRWGTLHLELVLAALEGAQAAGLFEQPWRESYTEMKPRGFQRTYVVGRLVSVAADLLTVFLVFLLGVEIAGSSAGLWAAALISFSPGHVLQASQIRVDVTATMLIAAVMLLAARMNDSSRPIRWLGLGVVAGLAVAAKYSAVLIVLSIVILLLYRCAHPWTAARWLIPAAIAGFLIGEPFVLTNAAGVASQVGQLISSSQHTPLELIIPKPLLWAQHLAALARFSLGVPAAILAFYGLGILRRRREPAFLILAAALAAGAISLLPQNWPLLRYQLMMLPACAVAAAVGIVALPRRAGLAAGALALAFALCASVAQVRFMLAPHPANLALSVIEKAAQDGEAVARLMPELPPFDPRHHPLGPNPLLDDLTKGPPPWVILTDLPIIDHPQANLQLLASRYDLIAVFRSRRVFNWATFGESGSPHDWKYTHPSMSVYRLRR